MGNWDLGFVGKVGFCFFFFNVISEIKNTNSQLFLCQCGAKRQPQHQFLCCCVVFIGIITNKLSLY